MANEARQNLEKRVQNALFQHALFRWESAVVISMTLLFAFFGPQFIEFVPGWAWLVGGLAAEAGLVYTSLTDPKTGQQVVEELLRNAFDPGKLHHRELQDKVKEAISYRSRIQAAIRQRNDNVLKDNLNQTAGQIDEWIENIYSLAHRLDRYQYERPRLEADRQKATARVAELKRQFEQESDPAVQQQMEATTANMRRQIETIEMLDNAMERAALQLENTLAALGTIYSQTMLVEAKDIDSGRAKRLRQEISDQVNELGDVLVAMDEVYAAEGQV
ncbi:MAG: hypothetical protein AB1791_19935 [Chloroflexota bacterium]